MLSLFRPFCLFCLFCLFYPIVLHAQFEEAFSTPHPRRIPSLEKIRIEHYVNANPYAQIKAFTTLKTLAEKKHDPQSVLYAKAWIANTEARQDTSKLKQFSAQMTGYIQQAKEYGNEILQAQLLIMLVDYLGDVHNHVGAALSYHILADEIMNKLKPDETPRPHHGMKHDLMIHLYEIGDYQRAKEIMDKSKGIELDPVYQFFYTDLHSQILLELHQYDSSAWYIMQARAMLDQDTTGIDKGWYGILEGNEAKIHYVKKEYAQAIPGLLNAVKVTYAAKIYNVAASFGLMLAKCYIQENEIDKIRPLIPMIKQAVYLQNRDDHYIDLYKLLLAMQDGNLSPERSLQLFDSIDIRKQNLAKQNDRNVLTKMEMEDEMIAYQERQTRMTAEIKRQLFWRNMLWASLGCALIITFYVFYKGNKRVLQEQKRSTLIQEQSDLELNAAREQLLHFATSIQEKSRQIELLENNIEANHQTESLEQLRQNTILTDEDWSRFKALFEKVHPGFFASALDKFPNLTAGEMRFLALVKLSFNTKEMASTLGVSPVSVRSIRSRLLKKLDLAENENLGQVVNSIYS